MSDLQYRGINNETGEYVYGWYTKLQKGGRIYHAIICYVDGFLTEYYIHNKDTIAQDTGMLDKNGYKIYSNSRLRNDSIFICDLKVYYSQELGMYRLESTKEDNLDSGDFIEYDSTLFTVEGCCND